MPDVFKKVAPYLLYAPQQYLLDAIAPQDINLPEQKKWQSDFYTRLVKQPIHQYLSKFEFEEDSLLEEKIKRVIAFLKKETNDLAYCYDHISDNHLQRIANKQLKFLKPIWKSTSGYTKNKALAAIRTLVTIEMAYFFIEELKNAADPFPLKERYQNELQTLIQVKCQIFEEEHGKKNWLDTLLKERSIKDSWIRLKQPFKKYFKKDLHLMLHCDNLWRQNIPYRIFFRNLSWVCLRLFRLCALPLPSLLFNLCLEIIPSCHLFLPVLTFCKKHLAPMATKILGDNVFQTMWHILEKSVLWSLCFCSLAAIFVGFPWFALLSGLQGIDLLLGTSLLATQASGLTAMMVGLARIAGPLMWIGIPIGAIGATSAFIGAGLLRGVLLPLKRIFCREKLPALETLKEEALESNKSYFREFAHAELNNRGHLTHPVYLDANYQVCLTQEEVNTMRRKAILPRFDLLNGHLTEFLKEKFKELNTFCVENPWYATEEVDHVIKDWSVCFRFQRDQKFDAFKEAVAEGVAQRYVRIEEKAVPRL